MKAAVIVTALTGALAVAAPASASFLQPCTAGHTHAFDIKKRGMTCNLARQVIGRVSNRCGDNCSLVHQGREYDCTTHTAGTNIYWRCATTGGRPYRLVKWRFSFAGEV
jgi:hypothetical protein